MPKETGTGIDVSGLVQRIDALSVQGEGTGNLRWSRPGDKETIDQILAWLLARGEDYLAFRLRSALSALAVGGVHLDIQSKSRGARSRGDLREQQQEVLASARKAREILLLVASLPSDGQSMTPAEAYRRYRETRGVWEDKTPSRQPSGVSQPVLLELRTHVATLEEGAPCGPISQLWFLANMVVAEHAARGIVIALKAAHQAELAAHVQAEYSAFHAAGLQLRKSQLDTDPRPSEADLEATKRRWRDDAHGAWERFRYMARVFVQTLDQVKSAVPTLAQPQVPRKDSVAGATPTPAVAQSTVKLNDTEENILEALGEDSLTGEKLAKEAGYPNNSNFRTTLSGLRKRGILENRAPGYCLASAYRHLLKKPNKRQDKRQD